MRLPSAHQHNFSAQPRIHIPRSAFDRRHSNSFTFDAGWLVPCFNDPDVLPGDTMKMDASFFARLNTPKFPIMTNVYMMVHWWAVPIRLLWEHWVNFMGEKVDPDDTTVYMTPQSTIPSSGYAVHSLQDYLGLPVVDTVTGTKEGLPHNVFLTRAYNMIWNMGYRDENLQDRVTQDVGDGPDDVTKYTLLERGKRHDYFTSMLPWAQKGDPVGISLTGNAPVMGSTTPARLPVQSSTQGQISRNGVTGNVEMASTSVVGSPFNTYLFTDLSSVSAVTINAFRNAFLAQEALEIDARGGTRYPEQIYAHFGVENPDARMQYPEFLGGDVFPLDITSVPQTSETGTTPQANLAAFGTLSAKRTGFIKSFTEHSVVLGLICVYADLTYSQGLARHWSRRTRADFYAPVFANLGEQAVLNKEWFAQGTAGGNDDNDTAGFQERWAEYRYMPNSVRGLFRPAVANNLAAWNLSQLFSDLPQLNDEFIVEKPPFDRVVVVQDEPDFMIDCYFNLTHIRPMPVNSVPVRLGGGGRGRFF